MLDLDVVDVKFKGRAKKPLPAVVERELSAGDIASLAEEKGSRPSSLASLRDRHHTLARLIASGTRDIHCSAVTGYSASRISILKSDPTFKELVAFYKDQQDEAYFDMHQQLAGLSADALLELRERLEDDPSEFSSSQLLEIVTRLADRTGHGPSSKTEVNVNVGLADRMDAARKRMKTINHEA